MVEFQTPRIVPQARSAGQVSNAGSDAIKRLGMAAQGTADTFTEFYEKEAAIHGERLLAEIQEEWGRTYNERSKGAGAGFSKSTLADYDAFVAQKLAAYSKEASDRSQANVPERNRQDIELALDKYRMRLETKTLAREAAARAAAKNAAMAATRRAKHNALISDPSLYAEYMETANKRDGEAYTRTFLSMQVRDDPQATLDDVMAGKYDTQLQPSQKMSFIKLADSGVARVERENEIELNAARSDLETALSEEIAFAGANGAPPVDSAFEPEAIAELYGTDPERGVAVVDQYKSEIAAAEMRNNVSMATPDQIESDLTKLQDAVSSPGNTPRDVQQQTAYVAALQQRNNAITDDAAKWANSGERFVRDIYGAIHSAAPEDQAIIAQKYTDALSLTYDNVGVPDQFRTVLPKQDATNQAAQFNDMGTDVAAAALSNYMDVWGEAAPMVLRQLEKAGLAPEYSVAMRHLDNPGLSQAIINLKGISTADLKQGQIKSDMNDADAALREGLVEYRLAFEFAGSGDAQSTMNTHYDVAERLVLDRMRQGESSDAAVEGVIAEMFPETVVTGNNGNYLIPDGANDGAIMQGTEVATTKLALSSVGIVPFDDPRFPEFADVELTRMGLETNGVWVNNSTGDGLQLMLSIEGYMIPAMLENGSPYSLTFDELANWPTMPYLGRDK